MRLPQLYMARLVQRAIEMGQPAVVEAGTGTGKTFSYAAVCMALNKKVIISTSNKALQMQLIEKDLPFLQRIWPGKKVAVSVGKGNYACRLKCEPLSTVMQKSRRFSALDLHDRHRQRRRNRLRRRRALHDIHG